MSNSKQRRNAKRREATARVPDDNRWIITSHRYLEHTSPTLAWNERNRLSAKFQDKAFYLYRIKRVVEGPEHRQLPKRWFARMIYRCLATVDRWT